MPRSTVMYDWRPYRETPLLPTKGLSEEEQRQLRERFGQLPAWLTQALITLDTIPMLAVKAPQKARQAATKVQQALDRARALLKQHPEASYGRIASRVRSGGGYSVNLATGDVPTSGIMVGKYPNTDPRVTVKSTLTLRDLVDHISKNLDALQKPENYLGLWRDPQTGQVYYDISRRFEPGQVRKATKLGESTIQKAAYDIDASKDLPVGNVYQFMQTPEYQQRLEDMYRAGIEAHGTGSWWPLKGGPIERVYGPEATPQMSGFLASMSGQLSPEDNLRYATEYRRRMIRGEPVIQPDFRVPETAVKFRPGGQMFGEATKTANLTKSAEARSLADLQKIQLDKQHDMARALMGETDVAVLDRRFAKLSEAPERGIYVDVEPDTIPGAMTQKSPTPYPHMENALRTAAKQRGMTLADYSAIVWEGIGSTIKRTGELYGTKYRAGAIPEPSGGFNPLFEKLVAEKAKAWGLSVPEFEARLARGDAELLSALLAASPVLQQAFVQWSSETPSSDRSQAPR